jgi:hypothetical protein
MRPICRLPGPFLIVLLVASCGRSPDSWVTSATVHPATPIPETPRTFTPGPGSHIQIDLTPTVSGQLPTQTITPIVLPSPVSNSNGPVVWDVYDKDPNHLWNRLFRALYGRTAINGQEYGRNELDPLLWQETRYLINGPFHELALGTLGEFLSTSGEQLITDPVRRAMLQRDLWAVFDWLTLRPSDDVEFRRELEQRLSQVIQRLALSRQQIVSLPDSYQAAVQSGEFPAEYQHDNPQDAFLPTDIFVPDGDWICLGREGGPIAMTHLQNLPFLGRSDFLVFLRVPGGRGPGLAYLSALQTKTIPPYPPQGTEVGLVRRMLLIDNQGEIVASPLIESVQLRYFYQSGAQTYFELILDRDRLFAGETGGLRPVAPSEKDFVLFLAQGDVFGTSGAVTDDRQEPVLVSCPGCHEDKPVIIGANSILSYSRARFPLPGGQMPMLSQTTPDRESETTIEWKTVQTQWQQLRAFWH